MTFLTSCLIGDLSSHCRSSVSSREVRRPDSVRTGAGDSGSEGACPSLQSIRHVTASRCSAWRRRARLWIPLEMNVRSLGALTFPGQSVYSSLVPEAGFIF